MNSSAPYPEDNIQDNDHQPTRPLGVELTGYYLLTTGVILGLGIPKAVYSYKGQALISTTLDWLVGVALALILFWLGVIDAKRPELSPGFFQVDLAPPILGFLCRPEVHLWFLSALLLLLNTMDLRGMLDARRNHEHSSDIPAHVFEDRLTLSALAFGTAICMFCVQCVRVIWPRVFRGPRRRGLPVIINLVIWLPHYFVVKESSHNERFHLSIVTAKAHESLSVVFPFEIIQLYEDSLYLRGILKLSHLSLVFVVVDTIYELPDSPAIPYISFSLTILLCIIPPSEIRGASKAAYDRVWGAGNNAWAYVTGGREM